MIEISILSRNKDLIIQINTLKKIINLEVPSTILLENNLTHYYH